MKSRHAVSFARYYADDYASAQDMVADKAWRLASLYSIRDKFGRIVPFRPNEVQVELYEELEARTVTPKSRQHGITTAMAVYELDECLFSPNTFCAIIAHTQDDAKAILETKVKFPFEKAKEEWPELLGSISVVRDNNGEIVFSNGSKIYVDVSVRSATVQYLHISEFGKICAVNPDRAREIVTGALNAITAEQLVVVESTAEGETGRFADFVRAGMENRTKTAEQLTDLDWKLLFFGWWRDKANVLPEAQAKRVVIPEATERYFAGFLPPAFELTQGAKAWYVKKSQEQGDDMRREHPSTVEECFAKSTVGAFYADQVDAVRRDGRIVLGLGVRPGVVVNTAWDLGYADDTSIWFFQVLEGGRIAIVDFYSRSGYGLEHYAMVLQEKQRAGRFVYGQHVAPHDLAKHDYGTGLTIRQTALKLGLRFEICPNIPVQDGINAVRKLLPRCWFDEKNCCVDGTDGSKSGFKALASYRRKWDERAAAFKPEPLHDWASHPCDAFRYLAVWIQSQEARGVQLGVNVGGFGGFQQAPTVHQPPRGVGYAQV